MPDAPRMLHASMVVSYIGVKSAISNRLSAISVLALAALAGQGASAQSALHSVLTTSAAEFPGKAGIWVKHLTTGETAGVRDSEMFNSHSGVKIPDLELAVQVAAAGTV